MHASRKAIERERVLTLMTRTELQRQPNSVLNSEQEKQGRTLCITTTCTYDISIGGDGRPLDIIFGETRAISRKEKQRHRHDITLITSMQACQTGCPVSTLPVQRRSSRSARGRYC